MNGFKRILTAAAAIVITVAGANVYAEAASENGSAYKGTLPTDGDVFTVMSYMSDDLDVMLPILQQAAGIDENKIKLVNFQVGGGEASECYDRYFLGGNDVDVFVAEPYWALKYLNDSTMTAPLSAVGISDTELSGQYPYTRELCRATNGVNKGSIMGAMYETYTGAWCYRKDLAEKYLGVNSPDEMQKLVSDWDGFKKTAAEVHRASNGKTALTATLNGIWNAYSCGRTSSWIKGSSPAFDSFHDDFIDLAKNMWDNGYVSHFSPWTDTWYSAGQTDEIMGYFVPAWGFGDAILNCAAGGEKGKTHGKWSACQGPQPYYWGGNMFCVYAKADNGDMAADLIRYFTVDNKGMQTYADNRTTGYSGYIMPNNKIVTQDMIAQKNTGLSVLGGESALEVLDKNASAISIKGTLSPFDADVKNSFFDAVCDYCNGDIKSKDECIAAFKSNAASHIPEENTSVPPSSSLKGDADLNGVVELADLVTVAKYNLNHSAFPLKNDTAFANADMNDDGDVNMLDTSALIEYQLGKQAADLRISE